MKHLKSTSQNLKELFEQTITVRFIAEPLRSFDVNSEASKIRSFMEQQGYDVIGIRRNGLIIGYVTKEKLSDRAVIPEDICYFTETELVDDTANLVEVFKMLRTRPQIYVKYLNEVCGIVTKGDLQKAPVRMWLFGSVSFLEMQLLRVIRGCYPNESWKVYLKDKRLEMARKLFEDRKAKNEEIDLADCLQFCDKIDILESISKIKMHAGITPQRPVKALLNKAKDLRDNLAHAQDIITGRWPEIAETMEGIESLLEDLEKIDFSASGAVEVESR